ncbi:vegetative incompatibility protein HET-E-1 [Rhizoctonia solani 123E]|uniref:Vegetative incompatibility protein HET-E-1 n=1 Tax=Rhizoctonia solani 123E TaxID=1423351 RepID=A0A074RLA2_9AGAM|nr:vegetative incompatibility protein HET-E-1 [Rhizoctonia solani 123E]
MSAEPPPIIQPRRGVRQILRSGVQWARDAVLCASDNRPPAGNVELLPASKNGSCTLSRSRPATPALSPEPTLIVPNERVESISGASPPAPSTKSMVPKANLEVATEHKKSADDAWTGLASSLRVLENSAGLFPPIKKAIGAFVECLGIVQRATSNRADQALLAEEFKFMADTLNRYSAGLGSESRSGSIANLAQSIERQVADIKRHEERGRIGRFLDVGRDEEAVIQLYKQIESLFRRLQCDVSMRTHDQVKKQLETTLLRGMFPVDDARYNSSYSTTIKRNGCTAETREAIHQGLEDWTTDPKSEKIYWMNGMAGTGKTTIAYSFCEWLEKTNRLGASFFCSRISSTCRSLNKIVPTIAYQLARYSPAFRSTLCSSLEGNPDAGTLNVMQQFEKLIQLPLSNVEGAMPESVVIVIDALDECDDGFSVRLLLNVLLKFAKRLPLKFFVSSRPEHVIWERMTSQGGTARSVVHLHDIEESIVEGDIKKYLTEKLDNMDPPPSSKQIELLARRSRNLFIYAATVVRYIHPEGMPVDSGARLESMLEAFMNSKLISKNKYDDLDRLYTAVLSAAFDEHLDDDEKDRMRCVLWIIVCAREPMDADTLASLACLTERQVWSALQSLRSVVHVPEDKSLISTLHASFPEYMLDESRSKRFYCDESKSNEVLIHRCFDVMASELRFNICALESSYLTDDQVQDLETRVGQCISPTLLYACRYWGSHLSLAPSLDNTRDMFVEFLSTRLLFWMEVLSLNRCNGIGAPMMQQAQAWLRLESNHDRIQKQVSDARNFVTWFAANPCSRSTPHIYISALPLCAKSSWVYQHYFQCTTGLISISISRHEEAVLAIWSLESIANSVAISPDGNRIANGSNDGSVFVYDMHTGAMVAGPFQGHTNRVLSVAFSPDGRLITSGSFDKTVIVWDAHTGRIVTGPLHKHAAWVWSVTFSPDGKCIVSGSFDRTIILWDTYSGAVAVGPLKGHSDKISSVAFSPDGRLIASGSWDRTIRLWDASTGAVFTEPLRGHTNHINMVAFSPDGSKLASCAHDRTIRVWDIKAGTIVGLPYAGHRGYVYSIAFSHDGCWIASGGVGGDSNIIVWDTLTGSVALGPLSGHTEAVRSVTFTPDNTRIVSGSNDSTIRIWNVQPQNKGPGQKGAHELSVGLVAFWRNHTQLISGSSTSTLKLWDIHTGMTIPPEFEGQAEVTTLHSITVSPQDTLVAVSASNLTIRLWNILTGKLVCQPLRGHKGLVQCLDFSSNGAQLCSGSDDATVVVWDIDTGTMVGPSYTGHMGAVMSVVFSPNTACIASSAADCTIRIWDTSTGTLVHTLNGHNTSVSSVKFAPNGNHIVSGSVDGAIRRWDVRAGTSFEPIYDPDSDPDSNSSRDRFSSTNTVCFSPDGTQIISGFGSSLCLIDTHTMKLISEISLPRGEIVCQVGCSPDGMDIISVSTSEGAGTSEANNDSTQQSAQSPNIIRVWRANVPPDQMASFLTPRDWSYEKDGRVMSPEGFVTWIPPDLIPHMKAHTKLGSESHYSTLVMSSNQFINIGYEDLCIGNRWAECYVVEN